MNNEIYALFLAKIIFENITLRILSKYQPLI